MILVFPNRQLAWDHFKAQPAEHEKDYTRLLIHHPKETDYYTTLDSNPLTYRGLGQKIRIVSPPPSHKNLQRWLQEQNNALSRVRS